MEKSISTNFVQIERRDAVSRKEFSNLVGSWVERIWESAQREQIPLHKLAGKIADNRLTPTDAPVPDCQTCGMCCWVTPWVQLTSGDPTSPEHYWDITIEGQRSEYVVDRALRRNGETGRCSALTGEVGKSVKCEIYQQRPQACRVLEAGSDGCHALRRAFGMEPPLNQMEIMHGMMKIFADEPFPSSARIVYSEISVIAESRFCEINVWLQNDEQILIHKFDAEKEEWLEGDFSDLTVTEARELILSRQLT